jgi:hypothetical protein
MSGILTPNEIRAKEGLSELPAGNDVFIPGNLIPLREEVLNAMMGSAKLKVKELESMNTD